MEREKTEKPFSEVLDALFTDEQIPIPLLYRLSDMPAEAFNTLVERWPAVAEERRRVIVRHLADISEENFVVDFSPFFSFCFQDETAAVRIAALDGVWDCTNLALIDPIIRLMQSDENDEVRAAAAAALAHYVLMAEWGELPRKISPRIVAALLAEYEKDETAVAVKRAALEALGAANHPRVPTLIQEAYEQENFDMQISAVFAMGNSADPRWLPIILEEMSNPMAEMRAEAARAAGTIGSSDAVPSLAELAIDEELSVGLAAVTSLGQIGSEQAREILLDLLDDPEFETLHETIDEALDEMDWLGGEFDLLAWSDDDEDENGPGLDDLRYN